MMTESMAYLLGCYLGDGCSYTRISDHGSSYQFSITSEDIDLCNSCQDIVWSLFQKKSRVKPVIAESGNTHFQLIVCSKLITTHFAAWTNKRLLIPKDVYESKDLLVSFSRGLMDTDGWICKTNPSDGYSRYRVGFKNTLPWVQEFRDILKSLDVKVGVLYPAKVKKHEKPAMAFTVNTNSYCSIVNFGIERKRVLAAEYFQRMSHRGPKKNI